MTHASLFSGIGGFDLGLELAGVETVAQCEIDEHARVVLAHHWPEVTRYHDITKLDGRDLRGVDVITGGFPCQDLSVAGKRKGLSGARSGLFYELARVVEEARPRLLLWENVPGLLNADERGAMGTVLGELADIGYSGCWRVLDSQFHGVPQRRRRVFGAFAPGGAGGWACGAAVLLEPEGGGWNPAEGGGAGEGVATGTSVGTLESRRRESADSAAAGHFIPEVMATLDASDGRKWGCNQWVDQGKVLVVNLDATPKTSENIAMTLRPDGNGRGSSGGKQYVFQQNQRDEVRLCGGDGQQVGALPSQPGMKQQNYVAGQWHGVRRLTPLEYERLQGFPDGWTDVDGMSDTQRYRQLGNAVSVPVAYWIGLRARIALEANP